MIENHDIWEKHLFEVEGGFSDRPLADDPGGMTMMGVTKQTLADFRGCTLEDISIDDMKAVTKEECSAIASAKYWNPMRCNSMPGGLDVYAADFAFNSGPIQAAKTLQRVLGLPSSDVDGFIGPITLTAAGKRDQSELIVAYHDARMRFLKGLKNWEANRKGWTRRCETMKTLALSLAPAQAPAAVDKADSNKRSLATWAAVAATAISTLLPTLMESLPEARKVYEQTSQMLAPYDAEMPYLKLICGAIAVIGILFLKFRSSTMAQNARKSGSAAAVVTS